MKSLDDLPDISKRPLDWPVAFRFRPASIPPATPLADKEGLEALIALCAPTARHDAGLVPLRFSAGPNILPIVKTAFANAAPEWRFVPGDVPHIAVASTMRAASQLIMDQLGQFLEDTDQPACQVSCVMERYTLKGDLYDITDTETYRAYYDTADNSEAHQMTSALQEAGSDGFMFAGMGGNVAVVLNPECFISCVVERAVAFCWDGVQFSRYYDYRNLNWAQLAS